MSEVDFKNIPLQPMFDKHIHVIYDRISLDTGTVTFTCANEAFKWFDASKLRREDRITAINAFCQVFGEDIDAATLLPDNYDLVIECLKAHKVENAQYSRVAELKMCDDTKARLADWVRNESHSFYLMLNV